ncbi:MAG: thiamine diphosphokinase [Kiritimatiellae bacterium]|nr:thiamine diphosphokinase [Kiritimatiellia bacterium]
MKNINFDYTNKTVIVADGDFPSTELPLECLKEAAHIVACDGAANQLLAHGIMPDWIVGDLDSLPEVIKEKLPERIVHMSEQESNDLSKAFRFTQEKGWDELIILGATGKREDHTLGNLALLSEYAQKVKSIIMVTDYGRFVAIDESTIFPSFKGEQISIFAISGGVKVTSEGLKYPLNELQLDSWWQATLNEALGEEFSLSFEKGAKLLVFLAR